MRKYLLILLVIIVAGGFYAYQEYNRKPADLSHSDPEDKISAESLAYQYGINEDSANSKFLGKILEVDGLIKSIHNDGDSLVSILLKGENSGTGVSCQIDKKHLEKALSCKPGQKVQIRGFCTGLLLDVELNRSVVIDK